MSRQMYYTIKVPKATKENIEKFKKDRGYPSYSQAITAIFEQQNAMDKLMEELKNSLAQEATRIVTKSFYEFLIDVLRRTNKPISGLTVNDLIEALRATETEK